MKYPFYYYNSLDCIRLLLCHLLLSRDLVKLLVKRFSDAESTDHVYSDMHTADGWWAEQEKLPKGGTPDLVICGSD